MSLLYTIALLCATPNQADQLACQKYYIKCVRKLADSNKAYSLEKCVRGRK